MTLEINKIYCADCLDLMKEMEDNSVDLVLTDPPYGIGANKKSYINGTSKSEKKYYDNSKTWDDNKIKQIYFDEMQRVSKNQIIFGGNYYFDFLASSRCFIIWDKTIHGNSYSDCEFAWTSFDSVARIYPVNMVETTKDGRVHPTQKPRKLIKLILQNFTEEGQTIFDPFLGSGTTAVACINTGRNFIGIEKDADYFEIAQKRVKEAQGQTRLF